jgi:hypothetical protein
MFYREIPINSINFSPQYFQYYKWDRAKVTIRMGVHVNHPLPRPTHIAHDPSV